MGNDICQQKTHIHIRAYFKRTYMAVYFPLRRLCATTKRSKINSNTELRHTHTHDTHTHHDRRCPKAK